MDDQPVSKLPQDDQPPIRPDLRAQEEGGFWRSGGSSTTGSSGGGSSSSTAGSSGGAGDSTPSEPGSGARDSTSSTPSRLSAAESAGPWATSGLASSVAGAGASVGGVKTAAKFVGNAFFGTNKRRAGTGIASLTIGGIITFFAIASGPFEFIQIAHLMEDFHFSSQQNEQDDRFVKEVRFIRYAAKGEVEKTRMGFLGNKFTNVFENKLNASGLSSAYSDKFGLLDGYVVDTENGPFKGMDEDQVKAYLAEKGINVDVVKGSEIPGHSAAITDRLVINASDLSFTDSLSLNYQLLKLAGYSSLSAAIGVRQLCVRAGCNLDPLSNKITSLKRSAEEAAAKKQVEEDEQQEETGQTPLTVEDDSAATQSDQSQGAEAANKAGIDGAISETNAGASTAGSSPSKFAAFKKSTSAKIAGGGLAAVGVLCMLRGVDDQAAELKQAEVELPLERMFIQAVALGNQVESGQNVNSDELADLSQQLYGKDSAGQTTSWYQSQSIQANLGNPNTGVKPDSTLTSIGQGVPFSSVFSSIPLLGTVCSGVGQAVSGVFGIALDFTEIPGLINTFAKGVLQSIAFGAVGNQIAHWLAGTAVDVAAVGADFGNDIDYGGALAGNAQAINSGGVALSSTQTSQMQSDDNLATNEQFKQQSLVHKILSPTDPQALVAKTIDAAGPNVASMFANMSYAFLHVGSSLANLPSLLLGKARAASSQSTYNYGFPVYGFSEQDMNNPAVENPYQNAEIVEELLSNPDGSGQTYIQRASECFGVTVAPDSSGRWDVTTPAGQPNTDPYDNSPGNTYDSGNCDEQSPANCTNNTTGACNWLRVRFFILDTETMNSMACYQGDDEACSDVGFGSDNSSSSTDTGTTSTASTPASGNAEQLAQQILNNKNIDTSYSPSVKQDLEDAAAGKPGTAGAMTSSAILKLIATIGETHKVSITAIQSDGQGHCVENGVSEPKSVCPNDPHYMGDAVDFGSLDGVKVTGRNPPAITIMKLAFTLLPSGSGFGQNECGSQYTTNSELPNNDITFNDTCNHLHVQVPAGTP